MERLIDQICEESEINKREKLIVRLAGDVDTAIDEIYFYRLDVDVIARIVQQGVNDNLITIDGVKKVISKLSQLKPESALSFLNLFEFPDLTFEERLEILGSFAHCEFIVEAKNSIDKKIKKIKSLETKLQEKEEKIEEKEKEIEDKDKEIEDLNELVKEIKSKDKKTKSELNKRIKELEEENKTLKANAKKVNMLKKMLNEKDEDIKCRDEEYSKLEKENKELKKKIEGHKKRIATHPSKDKIFDMIIKEDFDALDEALDRRNIEKENEFGITPLIASVLHGNIDLIQFMINKGANLTHTWTPKVGISCFTLADISGSIEVSDFLNDMLVPEFIRCIDDVNVEAIAKFISINDNMWSEAYAGKYTTVLEHAIKMNRPEIVKYFIDDVKKKGKEQFIFNFAYENKSYRTARALFEELDILKTEENDLKLERIPG